MWRYQVMGHKLNTASSNSRLMAAVDVSSRDTGPSAIDASGAGPGVRLILSIVGAVAVPVVDGRCGERPEDGSVRKGGTSDTGRLVVSGHRRGNKEGRCEEGRHGGHGNTYNCKVAGKVARREVLARVDAR